MEESNLSRLVRISADSVMLEGILSVPQKANGIVVFAHGSGSSRNSPRNNFVAEVLRRAGLATLLFDLLTEREDEVYENRFNISLLTKRLKAATLWCQRKPQFTKLTIGYFGASTGAAAALEAAADMGRKISAVVSRGGRPDMARNLSSVLAPTLLIVGGHDETVIELNQKAFAQLKSVKKLAIVPGATHLFEETGTLEQVAQLATAWFKKYLL